MNQTTNDCFTHLIRLTHNADGWKVHVQLVSFEEYSKAVDDQVVMACRYLPKFTLQDGGHTLVIDGNCTAIYRAEVPN